MDYLPLFLDIKQQRCLVFGGSEIAYRKITLLLKAHGDVTVLAKDPHELINQLARASEITLVDKDYDLHYIQQADIIISALQDDRINKTIAAEAKAQHKFINIVDAPKLCNFISPSIVDRSPVLVAMSSSGTAPVLLRQLREKLETELPANYGDLAKLAGRYREQIKQHIPESRDRKAFWEEVFSSHIAEQVFTGQIANAQTALMEKLKDKSTYKEPGEVYLVGAGPGDPDLLTLRALRLMQKADVVVYDRLVSPAIVDLVRRDADRIYVGKKSNQHTIPQDGINDLLVNLAKERKKVVRLKGGDPFIFGRGGEEIASLMAEGIKFQVVPGITAASGASTYCGIPLTHRDHAQSVVFATGHLKDGTIDLDWQALIQKQQTLVFYMGLGGLNIIIQQLIKHGLPKQTPVAVIRSATLQKQQMITGELCTIDKQVQEAGLTPPSIIIIGEVVKCQPDLQWYKTPEQEE